MATTYEAVRSLLDAHGVRYMVDPQAGALFFSDCGASGQRYMLVLTLTPEGYWLQLRSLGYGQCPADHPHYGKMLRLIDALNNEYRGVKFCWEPQYSEVVVYTDLFLADATPTLDQLRVLVLFTFGQMDRAYPRLRSVLATGEDPPQQPQQEELV